MVYKNNLILFPSKCKDLILKKNNSVGNGAGLQYYLWKVTLKLTFSIKLKGQLTLSCSRNLADSQNHLISHNNEIWGGGRVAFIRLKNTTVALLHISVRYLLS
uniref:Uncharacterized protein n=1 Tax=Sphaerodactylus townsendi TaxID=933632 RepID=A0ACB8EP18_9SAUR